MISTRNLTGFPDVAPLRRLMQSLAVLDAMLSPDWQYRYFSFNRSWAAGAQLGSMRNGQGDHYFAFFNQAGCWLKGFDHEARLSPFATDPPHIAAGMFEGLPAEFSVCLDEPAFIIAETTFCIWRRTDDSQWRRRTVVLPASADPDGSAQLLKYVDNRPETYREWAEEYYERDVPLSVVQAAYAHKNIERSLAGSLSDEFDRATFEADLAEIGYPAKDTDPASWPGTIG